MIKKIRKCFRNLFSPKKVERNYNKPEETNISGVESKFELFTNVVGNFIFTLKIDGSEILRSNPYQTKQAALKGISSVKANSTKGSTFQIRSSKDGKKYFVLRSGNNRVIGISGMYKFLGEVYQEIMTVEELASKSPVFEIKEGKSKKVKSTQL